MEETYPIRHQVLRPHQSVDDCRYPGDRDASTRHLGAFQRTMIAAADQPHQQTQLDIQESKDYGTESLIGICSIYQQQHPELSSIDSCQLRAMATLPAARGLGVGLMLLTAAEQHAQSLKHQGLWANARETALGFYQRAGYDVVSEKFSLPDIGAHWLVRKSLSQL